MNVFLEIKKLNFSPEKYVVIGGASMAARGIKETKDIDLLVSRDLLNELQCEEGWHYHPRIIPTEEWGLVNADGTVELYPTVGGIDLSFEDIKSREEIVEGIPLADLNDVLTIKRSYKREKDLKDIELIKNFLASK